MSPRGAAILSNPHPCGHIVYPSCNEQLLAEAVSLYASSGLKHGEAVMLILSDARLQAVDHRLSSVEGFRTRDLQQSGRLVYASAEKLLASFMKDGMPDEKTFKGRVGAMIERAQSAASRNGHPALVRAFGEMVNLLWGESVDATERLEAYWNDLIATYSISLMCSYSLDGPGLPSSLLECHSHNLQHE